MFAYFLLALGAFGILTSTIFLCMALLGARKYKHQCAQLKASWQSATPSPLPPLSVIKPIHGNEPRLRENLEKFFQQDYPNTNFFLPHAIVMMRDCKWWRNWPGSIRM